MSKKLPKPFHDARHFHDEGAALAWVEARTWPDGPVCPHCGACGRSGKMMGKTTRPGLHKCYACLKPFTVRAGSLFASSHVPLRHWLQAMALRTSSQTRISSGQLHRMLGVTPKTARFMLRRIREAMRRAVERRDEGGGAESRRALHWRPANE